ncbi:HAD-IA family hydrolase [Dyella sp.]|uniref:HAD family hydrolase n=1 Tax=Dyella sp. TaxID=1869338 RepID=UPI002D79070F|nr:HAD-IA family hydrolase [Dyella sp.]HET6432569.1 HAD-IA family hydrolase [Dyella sp.]
MAAIRSASRLRQCRHWVFDLDGTLTVALHDFAAIRRALGIGEADDILAHVAALPAPEANAANQWLHAHERELALAAAPAHGAVALVQELASRGCRLGILTRNLRELALITLQAIGLDAHFHPDDVLGREEAAPKPDPAGLLHLATRWAVPPDELVMVGDYAYDLACARAAGAASVMVNVPGDPWPTLTDWRFEHCLGLRDALA